MKTRSVASIAAALFVAALIVPLPAFAKYQVPEMLKERIPSAAVEKAPATERVFLCPVSGMKASKDISLMFDGKKVYFCCAHCEEPFLKSPGTYLEKHEKALPVENPRWKNPHPRS